MANKKTLKVTYNIGMTNPWEVLRQESEGKYHEHGRKYSINQLYSLHTNARKEYFFIFSSMPERRRYIEDLRVYKARLIKRRAEWEEEQRAKSKVHEAKVKEEGWKLRADTLVYDMRQSHEDKR